MNVRIDYSQYEEFFKRLEAATRKDFQKEFKKMLEAAAEEFLSYVRGGIIAHGNVDTGLMVGSFEKGEDENIWIEGGMSYEVGSNVYYTKYVNYGHHTRGGGSWVEGSHFWEESVRVMEHMFPQFVQAKFSQLVASIL